MQVASGNWIDRLRERQPMREKTLDIENSAKASLQQIKRGQLCRMRRGRKAATKDDQLPPASSQLPAL